MFARARAQFGRRERKPTTRSTFRSIPSSDVFTGGRDCLTLMALLADDELLLNCNAHNKTRKGLGTAALAFLLSPESVIFII
jgi:hypothetical protein